MLKTLAQVSEATGFAVLEHLEADLEVPVLDGLQAQGDLFIIPIIIPIGQQTPTRASSLTEAYDVKPVPPEGVAVIAAVGSGHEHRLFAGTPDTAMFGPANAFGADIGVLECTAPAYVLHPEHGATGIAPGLYVLRRQREQADEERLVAD